MVTNCGEVPGGGRQCLAVSCGDFQLGLDVPLILRGCVLRSQRLPEPSNGAEPHIHCLFLYIHSYDKIQFTN
jgi:hypothetical protein